MNICIPGGASYIGAFFVPQLLADGHKVTVYDTLYFGDGHLPQGDENLRVIRGDVRDVVAWAKVCEGQDAVIYLASISRELMCQQNEKLAHEVNVACFEPDVITAKEKGVKRFIYASSVAVYGSSDHEATEDEPLAPTTIYGRGKAACEEILWKHQDKEFCCVATRSASVCGYSPRQRLDLTINRMVHDVCRKGVITVEGGEQVRSHIHIHDLCDFYKRLLVARATQIAGQTFNVVTMNQSILESAEMVIRVVSEPTRRAINMPFIKIAGRVDDRSYAVDGTKAREMLGFVPGRSIEQAVRDLKAKFDSDYWQDSLTNPVYQNMAQNAV